MALARTTSPAILSSAFQGAAASQAFTSNTFSPPAGSLIVVMGCATQSFNNAWNAPTMTDSLATHLTWNLVDRQNDVTFSGATSQVAIWWALCPSAQTNMTVTQTASVGGSGQTVTFSSLAPAVWTGADTVAPVTSLAKGYTVAQALAAAASPAGSGSALLMAAANQAAASVATTAGTGEFLVNETHSGSSFAQVWYGTSGGPTIPATAQTLDMTGNAAAKWQYIAYEIKAASGAVATPVRHIGKRTF